MTLKCGQRSLNVIETGAIRKLGCGFLFAFYSNCGRICSRLWDIQCQRMAWPWKPGELYLVPFSSFLTLNIVVTLKYGLEVTQGHWKWYHLKVWVRTGWPRRNFVKVFDADKTRMIGLPYSYKNLWRYVKPFSSDTVTLRTDRQTVGRTDRQNCSINIARQCADAR